MTHRWIFMRRMKWNWNFFENLISANVLLVLSETPKGRSITAFARKSYAEIYFLSFFFGRWNLLQLLLLKYPWQSGNRCIFNDERIQTMPCILIYTSINLSLLLNVFTRLDRENMLFSNEKLLFTSVRVDTSEDPVAYMAGHNVRSH